MSEATIGEAIQESGLIKALEAMKPSDPSEERRYIFQNTIVPGLRAAGFDARFWKEIVKWPRAGQKKTKDAISKLLCGCGAIVAMIGKRGTGKTTIASQVAIDLEWAFYRYGLAHKAEREHLATPIGLAKYRKLASICEDLKPLYSDMGSIGIERIQHYRDVLCECGLLVIDEKQECDLRVAARILPDIIDRRYAKRKDTIIISNEKPDEFEASTSDSILSRMKEHGETFACEWESFR